MRKFAVAAAAMFALAVMTVCTAAHAVNYITSAVFSVTSTATTSTANLRVAPMTPKTIGRDENASQLQTYMLQANQVQNLFLTKNQTVDLSSALCLWVQVDQDTKMKVNAETAYMILPSGHSGTICFK